jgi:hypothetical protein
MLQQLLLHQVSVCGNGNKTLLVGAQDIRYLHLFQVTAMKQGLVPITTTS